MLRVGLVLLLAGCTHVSVARWDFTSRDSSEWCQMSASGAEWPDAEAAIEDSLRAQFQRVDATRTHDPDPKSMFLHWTPARQVALQHSRANEPVFATLFVGRGGGWVVVIQRSQDTMFCVVPRPSDEGVELVPVYAGATAS